jgi:positive regulator of sigma E activity
MKDQYVLRILILELTAIFGVLYSAATILEDPVNSIGLFIWAILAYKLAKYYDKKQAEATTYEY